MINKYWPVLIILILSIFVIWPLLVPGYFSHHDDVQLMRVYEMRNCIQDFQIPCRWSANMGFGNGFPLFNYYSVFPYYLGAFLSFFFGILGATKLLFSIPLILGGTSFYFLAKELFGKTAGLAGAALYLLAPYRALDAYVRGAVAESFAIAIIPLVFYFSLKLSKQDNKRVFLALAVSWFAFLTSHNITVVMYAPVLLVWLFFLGFVQKNQNLKKVLLSFAAGTGLSAFYLIPAFFEKSLVQTETLTRFFLDFRMHFVTVRQLFVDRSWGYGASVLGPADTISFQVGWPHWWFVGIMAVLLLIFILPGKNILRRSVGLVFSLPKDQAKYIQLTALLIAGFIFSVFMTHNRSAFVWEIFSEILKYAQFPWRFLTLSILFSSLLASAFIFILKRGKNILVLAIVLLTLLFNVRYFIPAEFDMQATSDSKLSGDSWSTQQKASVLDYLPSTARQPRELAPPTPVTITGNADILDFSKNSDSWKFRIVAQEETAVEIPVFDFPGWQVRMDGKTHPHNNENHLGRIGFTVPPGEHLLQGKLTNTPLRTVSNLITLISAGLLLLAGIYEKNRTTDK